MDNLLSTKEVADRIGCSRATIPRLVAAGQLEPTHKAPGPKGAYAFAESEVARFINDRQDTTGDAA